MLIRFFFFILIFCSSSNNLKTVMSAGVEALLDAARFIELQEQERLSSSSSSSSLSTSPHSRYSSSKNFLSSTPPASPSIDGRNGDFINGGSKIIRSGKFHSMHSNKIQKKKNLNKQTKTNQRFCIFIWRKTTSLRCRHENEKFEHQIRID